MIKNRILLKMNAISICLIILMSLACCSSKYQGQMADSKNSENSSGGGGAFLQKNNERGGFTKISDNTSFELYVDKTSGAFSIVDKATGKAWYSNPVNPEDDKRAKNAEKNRLRSSVFIDTVNAKDGKKSTYNNYSSSIRKSNALYEDIKNGYRMTYNFSDEKISIPVEYRLEKEGVRVSVNVKEIKEAGDERIFRISLLPFFLASGQQDEGYMIVPDGSGSIINLNNGKLGAKAYQQSLFGRNEALFQYLETFDTRKSTMPVYALKNKDSAMLAVITKGEADASIKADVSGRTNSYNNVFCSFDLRYTDIFSKVNERQVDVDVYQSGDSGLDTLEVLFIPQAGNNLSYSDIALVYRDYLIRTYDLEQRTNENSLYLTIHGGLIREKPFMGIPVKQLEKLSTFKETEEVLRMLYERKVDNLKLRLSNWSSQGIKGKIPSVDKPEKALGGKRGFQSLLSRADSYGYMVLPEVNVSYAKNVGFFGEIYDTAKTMRELPIKLYDFKANTYLQDMEKPEKRLINVEKLNKVTKDSIKSLSKIKFKNLSENGSFELTIKNVAVNGLFDYIYQDYGSERPSMTTTYKQLLKSLENFSDKFDNVLSDSFSEKALPFTSSLLNLPEGGSGFDITDEQIPFLQIALSGLVEYSFNPLNLDSDPHKLFLKTMELGGNLQFEWIAVHADVTKHTDLDRLYGAYYKPWVNEAAEYYKQIGTLKALVNESHIIEHRQLTQNVYKTTYENGTSVLVNYNKSQIDIDGKTIPGQGYLIEERD